MKKISSVAIKLRPNHNEEIANLLNNLMQWLGSRGIKAFLYDDGATTSDLIISLGGDGTLIGLCRSMKTDIPILGVNKGNMGFITQFHQSELFTNLEKIILGHYTLIQKPLFAIEVLRNNQSIFKSYFFNDAVISKLGIARMFSLGVYSFEDSIFNLSGDGLIVSTTTGSTAYSLAAGGPIVHPRVNALILTPINPHSLTHRPIVVPDNLDLKIKLVSEEQSVILTLDGQETFEFFKNDEVRISLAQDKKIHFIKNRDRSYFRHIREKFIQPSKF